MSPVEKDPAEGLNGAVAATFRGERGALGMTFDELAERSGVPVRSLMRFLNAQRHMDMSVVEAIAVALSMTPAEAIASAEARLAKTRPDFVFRDEESGRVVVAEAKASGHDQVSLDEIKASALPKAARQAQSRGRALRRHQDEDAEVNQDNPGFDVAFDSQVIDVDDPTERPASSGARQRGGDAPD